jgi:hypothetical protein
MELAGITTVIRTPRRCFSWPTPSVTNEFALNIGDREAIIDVLGDTPDPSRTL